MWRATPTLCNGEAERLTVSVGLAAHPPHGVTALTLMDVAHSALTAAKEAGRNG